MVDQSQLEVVTKSIDAISKIAVSALTEGRSVVGQAELERPVIQRVEIAKTPADVGGDSTGTRTDAESELTPTEPDPEVTDDDRQDNGESGGDDIQHDVKSVAAAKSLDKEVQTRIQYIYLNTPPSLIQQKLGNIMLICKVNGRRQKNYMDCSDDELELRRLARIFAKNASLTHDGAIRVTIADGRDPGRVKVVWRGWSRGGETISDSSKRADKLEELSA